MGIFSLFGKKDQQQSSTADKDGSRSKQDGRTAIAPHDAMGARAGATHPPAAKRDAQAALATAKKIDAIESEMSNEFIATTILPQGNTLPGFSSTTVQKTPPKLTAKTQASPASPAAIATIAAEPARGTSQPSSPDSALPDMVGTTTQLLLDGVSVVGEMATPATSITPVVEEAAIMFANGQNEVVEQLLLGAISDDTSAEAQKDVWLMLFDLYQATGKRQEFENLAVEYASKFETSPPGWTNHDGFDQCRRGAAETAPTVPFSGKLDASACKQIERIRKLATSYCTLRLEFPRVASVEVEGCALLLDMLNLLQKSGHDLILVGAPELAEKIRAIIEVGRRDDTEPAWLLLMEILRLLNREKEFEETSIDYCITFEVSPPAFVTPKNKVTTAGSVEAARLEQGPVEGFMMPAVVEGRIDDLIVAIASYSDEHSPAIIDCSQLTRMDFNAAGRLLSGLAPFCTGGKSLEFHHVSHLVAALFGVIGLKDIVRIVPRKN